MTRGEGTPDYFGRWSCEWWWVPVSAMTPDYQLIPADDPVLERVSPIPHYRLNR